MFRRLQKPSFWISVIALFSACGQAPTTVQETNTPAVTPKIKASPAAVQPDTTITSGQITSVLEHGDQSDVHDLAFSPDGHLLAGGGTSSAVRIWDLASGEVLQQVPLNDGIYGLAFSPMEESWP